MRPISRPCFCGPRSPINGWARTGRRRTTIWATWPPNLSPSIGITHLVNGAGLNDRLKGGVRSLGPRQGQLIRFAVVGILGVGVNSASLSVLYRLAHLALPVSSAISTELAIASNFLLDDRWTFAQRGRAWTRFAKFNLTALLGLVLTALTVWFLVDYLGVHYLLANVL